MERILIKDTVKQIGQPVKVAGWVESRRDHGGIVFLDVRDGTGILQIVCNPVLVQGIKEEYVITAEGKIQARPPKMINPDLLTGQAELKAEKLEVLAKAEILPFDLRALNVSLPTLLDWRPLTLRNEKIKDIFRIQAAVIAGFRRVSESLDCVEIFVPTISASATEGGAEVFKIDYYNYPAFLTQSPQLYKQMMVPVFERVYTISHAYRAEPSVTTRHLSEVVQLDCEFGFVDFRQLLDLLEKVGRETLRHIEERCPEILQRYGAAKIVCDKIPRLTLSEAQEVIYKETGRDVRGEKDLGPQDETDIGKWALREHRSDLVTITHFPTQKRAFYTMPDPQNPNFSLSCDLLFRGMEICSGSQRINNYDQLVEAIKNRGLEVKNFEMYLQAFKYGMPPEGGFSFGLERITKGILNLENVREASLFPRDMERIDQRLSLLRPKIKTAKAARPKAESKKKKSKK